MRPRNHALCVSRVRSPMRRSMRPLPITSKMLALALLALSSLLGLGCGANGGDAGPLPPAEGEQGTLSIALAGASDIAGFQIDITRGGASVYSAFVAANASDAGTPKVSTVVALPPGDYVVTATAMLGP